MSAIDLVRRHPHPSEAQVRAELDGNLCRCTGYHGIVKAVLAGAAAKS
jgi:carbon-monoxide dehydrogenase small subunit